MGDYMTVSKIARAALLASCAILVGTSIPAFAADDMVRIRTNSDLRSIDPGVNRDFNTDLMLQHVLEGLVAFREDATIAPMLAKSYDISPDGLTYTFTLRDDVKFHNGETMTIDHVLAAWNRYMDPATEWFCRPHFAAGGSSAVKDVKAVGTDKLVFELEQPSGLFLFNMARYDCGATAIYHPSSVEADGKITQKLIATGPYQLSDWRRGQYIGLSKFEDYSALEGGPDGYAGNKTPQNDIVRFMIIPDAAAAKTALLAGDLDLDWQIDPSQIADYEKADNVKVESFMSMGITFLAFQTRDPKVADVRIRKAIELSLDYPQMVAAVSDGRSEPSRSFIPRMSSYYQEKQSVMVERNIEKAKELLQEAGYKREPISVMTNRQYPEMHDIAILAQAMALEAGINLQIDITDFASHGDRLRRGAYEMQVFGYGSRIDPSLIYDAATTANKDKEPNKIWENAEAKDLIRETQRVVDVAERQALFDKLEEKFREEIPLIPIFSKVVTSAARANIEGYKPAWTVGMPRAWSISVK